MKIEFVWSSLYEGWKQVSFSDKRKKMKGVEMGSLVVLTQLAPMNSLLSHFPASNNCAQQMTSASQASCLMHEALSFDPVHPRLCSHLLPAEGPRASSDLLRAGSGAGIPRVPPHWATAKPSSVSCHVQSSLLNALGATTSALLQEPTCGTSPLGRKKRVWVSILTAWCPFQEVLH